MSLPRFFVADQVQAGQALTLPDNSSHHLTHVLRLAEGDEITIFNGEGGEYRCRITGLSKKAVTVLPEEFLPVNRTSELKIHLGMCILKRDAMDRVITRVVELGVSAITPIESEHCTVARKVIQNRASHWQQVVYSACEQCGLNTPPVVHPPSSLPEWVANSTADLKLISVIGAASIQMRSSTPSSVSLLVGPEGGFAGTEVDEARDAGFLEVTFGERILRAETAPVIALSVLHFLGGDFR